MRMVCSSPRQIITPTPYHSIFTGGMPFLTPNRQCQSSENVRMTTTTSYVVIVVDVVVALCARRIRVLGLAAGRRRHRQVERLGGRARRAAGAARPGHERRDAAKGEPRADDRPLGTAAAAQTVLSAELETTGGHAGAGRRRHSPVVERRTQSEPAVTPAEQSDTARSTRLASACSL